MFVNTIHLSSFCCADRDIFPLCQDAVSEVGKSGYPGGLITRRAVSTSAKIAGGRKFKSTPRYCFFSNRDFVFSMPYLCNGFVRCLWALGVGIYNPGLILRSCSIRIFFVLRSLCLHLSH